MMDEGEWNEQSIENHFKKMKKVLFSALEDNYGDEA